MNGIERYEEYDMLMGFKFYQMYDSPIIDDPGHYATVMSFYNDNHVMVDLTIIDGEFHIGEPYAINDCFERIDK